MRVNIDTDRNCPTCGAVIRANSPGGQCVGCLLRLGIEAGIAAKPERPPASGGQVTGFGDYELIEELGRGGMGVVWKAHQVSLNRPVALKLLLEGRFATEGAIKRFEFEAEAAANLDHPNIVPIYGVGQHEGWPYFAMKLIDGSDLGQRIPDYALPITHSKAKSNGVPTSNGGIASRDLSKSEIRDLQARVAALIAKIARAVHYAHQRGILHRDLKPSNIIIDASGEPHVTDFGVAKLATPDGRLTVTGVVLGSPHYMAPEQASGQVRQVTSAADIYSLGTILYELLTGQPPFQGDTPLAIMRQTADEEPKPPSALRPGLDRDLETICLKCLAKSPTRRYPSAEALADDLEKWVRREPISARPPTRWERGVNHIRLHPIRAALTGIALLALLLTATFFYGSARTYYWLMAKINGEHLIVPPGDDGVYRLKLRGFDDFRCTFNFWKEPFWIARLPLKNRYARIEFTNIPPDLANRLTVRVFSDIPGLPDPAKTPPLTNGQVFLLGDCSVRERAFYFGAVNFQASNVLARAPDAGIRVVLLGRLGDPDPYKPAGALTATERY